MQRMHARAQLRAGNGIRTWSVDCDTPPGSRKFSRARVYGLGTITFPSCRLYGINDGLQTPKSLAVVAAE